MKLAKNAGCACGSGLLYKDICWLHSLGRPGREEPGSEMCKEIETTRRLLKEHSTRTLTASLCEHEATKTWSGKLPSLYFTQQENLGCSGWQNNLGPPKIHSQAFSFCSGLQLCRHTKYPTWAQLNFSLLLWSVIRQNKKCSILTAPFWNCSLHMSDVMCSPPQDDGSLVFVPADSHMPVVRPAYMHPCTMLYQCSVWQVETGTCFRLPVWCSMAPQEDALWCHTADVFIDMAAVSALTATTQHTEPST